MDSHVDELATHGNGRPPTLPPDATLEDAIESVNALTRAARTHSIELEGLRLALQEHGTRIETFCQRIERALGVVRNRSTIPPPPGDTT